MKLKYIIKSLTSFLSGSAQGTTLPVAVGMLCLLVLAACSGNDDVAPADSSQNVVVTFTMSVGDEQEVTRAQNIDWTDYDSIPGHDFENAIDFNKVQVVLYDAEGRYVSNVEHMSVARTADSTKYRVVGDAQVNTLNLTNNVFSGKVAVFANTNTFAPEGEWLGCDDNRNMSFDYTPGTALSNIPMFGVKTVSNLTLTAGTRNDIGDIWLLRAMAKVNVDLTEDMVNRGYTLTKVTLNGFNTKGYVVPDGFTTVDNTRLLTYDDGEAMSFHPFSSLSATTGEGGAVVPDTITFTGRTLYLPEYDNSTTPSSITVTIRAADGSTRTATFPFAQYTDGNRTGSMNIVRNHAYVFHVYGSPIKLDLKVEPWTVITHPRITM